MQTLCRDFYRPVQMGEAFYHLYPDEYYSWETSSVRVLQIVKRLRWWLAEHQIPLTIKLEKSNLFLRSTAPIEIVFSSDRKIQKYSDLQWEKLTRVLKENKFTTVDVSKYLNLSDRSARRLMSWAKKSGLVTGGRGTGQKNYNLVNRWKHAA